MEKNILYISYDGMTDPLGKSQIIPYLAGLTKEGYRFTILSCEKKNAFSQRQEIISALLQKHGINWVPVTFTARPPVVSKLWDVYRLRKKAFRLHRKFKFDIIHCRSYIAAGIGLALKKQYGCKFLFDMRGFWADEKRDGGSWNTNNFFFRYVYSYYKQKEKEFIAYADYIIVLTHAAQKEMEKWPAFIKAKPTLAVIPCCADMEFFSLTSKDHQKESRIRLGIPENSIVVSYLGSLGAWYMIEEMLLVFKAIKEKYSSGYFLFITHSDPEIILSRLDQYGLSVQDVKILKSAPEAVPDFVKASNLSFSFIKPVYSKISSSPTKLGELLSMGIPVICNKGVGDVAQILADTQAGFLMDDFSTYEIHLLQSALPEILSLEPALIRKNSEKWIDLKQGIEKYKKCYAELM